MKTNSGHTFLRLATIEKYVPLMEVQSVSEVARSSRGFLTAYRQARGKPTNLPDHWHARRDGFIARHMAQLIGNDEGLFGKDGLPTRRHLALIAWAYSPQPQKL